VSAVTPGFLRLKCTATFPSTVLMPGDPTGVQVTIENLGHDGIEYQSYWSLGDVVIKDASGTVLWDGFYSSSLVHRRVGPDSREMLEPGEVVRLGTADDPIRWPGPLTLSVVCLGFGLEPLELPPVHARVAIPGPPPDPAVALNRVLQKTGGLFDDCRPTPDGSPTEGLLRAPDVSGVPPMAAACTAKIEVNAGFEVVSLSFETPPDGPSVEIPDDFYQTRLPGAGQLEVGRWVFLVTDDTVVEILRLASVGRSLPGYSRAPHYDFRDGGWSVGEGDCTDGSRDRSIGFVGGGIWFIGACVA
jgi:hypothetical protein